MAYFVTPEELITSGGINVRELGIGECWYEAQPDSRHADCTTMN
ncbi:Uncharacterised protein [Mycobacteroides abscessus subsp. massiliense]|nr:Uncharacterised protein [Mycobacteroides abscessus subsp. massiliense]